MSATAVPQGLFYFSERARTGADAAQISGFEWPSEERIRNQSVPPGEAGIYNTWASIAKPYATEEERRWVATAREVFKALAAWQSNLCAGRILASLVEQSGQDAALAWIDKVKAPLINSVQSFRNAPCPRSLSDARKDALRAIDEGMAAANIVEDIWRQVFSKPGVGPPDYNQVQKEIRNGLERKHYDPTSMTLPLILFQCEKRIRAVLEARWIPDDLPSRLVALRGHEAAESSSGRVWLDAVMCQYAVGDWAILVSQSCTGIRVVVRRISAKPEPPSEALARMVVKTFLPTGPQGSEPRLLPASERTSYGLRGQFELPRALPERPTKPSWMGGVWYTDGQAVAVALPLPDYWLRPLRFEPLPGWFDRADCWQPPAAR
jgi:hypothetical protein